MNLADQLASLTPEQRAALELKLRARQRAAPASRIPLRSDRDVYELSLAQQRLWFVEQLYGQGAAYHISAAVRVEGELSIDALQAALSHIVARHEVLRTTCHEEQGRLVGRVVANVSCPVTFVDLERRPESSRLDEARRTAAAEAERPFDLAVAPLLRASVIRLSRLDHVLVLVVHHIAADAWSIGVLGRELEVLYRSFRDGSPPSLPALPVQYADFAAWQNRLTGSSEFTRQIDWWEERLKGAPTVELPGDRPRPSVAALRGSREERELPPEIVKALSTLSQARGVTLFTTLLAAYNVLVSRWTGQRDMVIGTPIAGRNWADVEPLIGLFINTLVLRCDTAGNPTFAGLLERARETVAGALSHQDVPFDQIVDRLHIERTLSHAPLTPIVFGYQNVPPATVGLDELRVSRFSYERTTTRFDLSLLAVDAAGSIQLAMEYSTDLFEPATVRRLLDGYECVLEAVVRDPGAHIGTLPVMRDAERRRIVQGFNQTARDNSEQLTVADLVARHAAHQPEAVAVSAGGRRLTYGELERLSTALAHRLVAHGVRRESLVGLLCDRGIAFVVSALAVMKAGGAYAPFDPKVPQARLRAALARAGIRVLLVNGDAMTSGIDATVLTVDVSELERSAAAGGTTPLDHRLDLDQLAYVVHTSGSTGEPNGVGVTHRGLMNLVAWHNRTYSVTSADVAAQVANVGFDACVWELWPYLAAGAAIHVPGSDTRDVPEQLWQWIAETGVTVTFLPTPLAESTIQAPIPPRLALRAILTGGDRLHAIAQALPFALVNHYGPTESTVVTSAWRVDTPCESAPPIGTPIDNTEVYVLDPDGSPVPVGVFGELHIGGRGLARGYVGAVRLTADRFIPDAVSGRTGSRLYRTGDIVRFRENGALEFFGRRDHQVKVRGHRIELGEIEAALARHPGVAAAAANAVPDGRGGSMLVGYVVASGSLPPSDDEIRTRLKESLPDYMVPAAVVRLKALPLTNHGKLDRAALPVPSIQRDGEREVVAPRNEAEEIVVQVCRELLRVDAVSVVDNFFELGGHSLLVAQLAYQLKKAFETEVTVRMVFESATLAELADAIVARLIAEDEAV